MTLLRTVLPVHTAQSLLLALAPQGGQHIARRNAWAGMVGTAARTRAHRDVDQTQAAGCRPGQEAVRAR